MLVGGVEGTVVGNLEVGVDEVLFGEGADEGGYFVG